MKNPKKLKIRPFMFDTHSHLNFKAFSDDYKQVIEECIGKNLYLINVGADLDTSQKAIEISDPENKIFASVGVHPLHVREGIDYQKLSLIAEDDSVVAVGEAGLDSYSKAKKNLQKDVFLNHLEIADKLNLPLILHCRKMHEDLLEILPEGRGVIHCFTGTLSQAKRYIEKGYLIGFNGIIFKLNLKNVIEGVPVDKILLETDCPFLHPAGGDRRNDPMEVETISKKVAEIKNMESDELLQITKKSACKLFEIN